MSSIDISKITKERAREILKEIMGPPLRELTGDEKDQVWLILQFIDPVEVSNNQHSITEIYHQGDRIYHVHYFTMAEDPMIEIIEVDEN